MHGAGPVDLAWPASPYSLPRTPSGFAVTYDSVFRVPQAEVRVLQVIGEGTFGEVVLAYNSVFGRVAVKWLKVLLDSSFVALKSTSCDQKRRRRSAYLSQTATPMLCIVHGESYLKLYLCLANGCVEQFVLEGFVAIMLTVFYTLYMPCKE